MLQGNRARLFAVFRHPLERAVSKYYSDLVSHPNLGKFPFLVIKDRAYFLSYSMPLFHYIAGYTLPQYVRAQGSRYVQNNYITRNILGQYTGVLDLKHLDYAREFLRRKVIVGLARDLSTSAAIFNRVFGWNETDDNNASNDGCYRDIFHALSDKTPPTIEEGSEGWKLLVAQNWYDLKVYDYIEHLFEQQLNHLNTKPLI